MSLNKMSLNPSAQKVQDVLHGLGLSCMVVEFPDTTRSAAEAAEAIGCRVCQIAKSLVFQAVSGRPVLVIASGSNRVNEEKLAALVKEPVKRATPDFVREQTGFVIGGVPPVGHKQALATFIDQDLLQHVEIWAAAGHPHAVFKLSSDDLVKMTSGEIVDIK